MMGGVRLALPDTLAYAHGGGTEPMQIREGEGEGGRDLREVDELQTR